MSSAVLSRSALRQTRTVLQRRWQSSTTESAKEAVSEKAAQAKEGASQAVSKAQSGLSRVTSSAGNVMGSAGQAISGIGGRTGRLIGYVQGLIPPTLYYARVGGELAKIIYRGRSMQPPTVETFQGYLRPVTNAIRNPSSLQKVAGAADSQNFLSRVRNLDGDTLVGAGIVAAEVLGFFCIGEMIGRFKVVGYRGGNGGHGEHH
ncbi:mitochondrial ATP synthase g subunit-domain-containing protein [Neohortaea acidophila]|uniref:Mitochondrial ATP synthase g subunit-domain-containing protein n=1 Tax=Neohortaea acidophila TaxID=245834 RepID=A0A6A6PU09_9PEZI|nr:mitochondrial ATP synthase g subunit-domain-containing protein [Neohortaea acidophila]KAF2483588.1 mitochondrial ATP synthase g subunit-domain-containing protein [Neohortaea acidophila]